MLLRGMGVKAGKRFNEILDAGFPDAFLLGWWFDTLTECAAGKCPNDGAAGHFINQVLTHVPPPKQYAALAGLDADAWAELVNCARTVHARTLCDGQPYEPPTHYLSAPAQAQWPLFARLFTTGEARASPRKHYALQNEALLWVLAKDAFAVEVDDWLAERKAQHEQAERETG